MSGGLLIAGTAVEALSRQLWVSCAEAQRLVRYDSNRVALWELNQKIRGLGPRDFAGATAGG